MTDFWEVNCHESSPFHTENGSHVDAIGPVHIPRNKCRNWVMVVLGLASLPIGGISRPEAGAPSVDNLDTT